MTKASIPLNPVTALYFLGSTGPNPVVRPRATGLTGRTGGGEMSTGSRDLDDPRWDGEVGVPVLEVERDPRVRFGRRAESERRDLCVGLKRGADEGSVEGVVMV